MIGDTRPVKPVNAAPSSPAFHLTDQAATSLRLRGPETLPPLEECGDLLKRIEAPGEYLKDFKITRFPNGDLYRGERNPNSAQTQPQGFGKFIWKATGDEYVGEWKAGCRHGIGRQFDSAADEQYVGHWWQNRRAGQGVLISRPRLTIYTGGFFNNAPHGSGELVQFEPPEFDEGSEAESEAFRLSPQQRREQAQRREPMPDASTHQVDWVYTGDFVNGHRQGRGTQQYSLGTRYEGEWVADKYHGDGRFFHEEVFSASGMWYNGELRSGVLHLPQDGITYRGEIKEMRFRHGIGRETHTDGWSYEGEFRDDTRHGLGTYTYPSGSKSIGSWIDGAITGPGQYVNPEGVVTQVEYRNGQCIKIEEGHNTIIDEFSYPVQKNWARSMKLHQPREAQPVGGVDLDN